MMADREPIVIAGAGPVGCVLALYLARAKIPVVLLERGATLPEDLRASTFHPPTLDMLESLDLTAVLIDLGVFAPTYQYRDRRSGAHAIFDLAVLAGETRHPYRLQCEQYKLTRLICERLAAMPLARVQFGAQVVGFEPRANGIDVEVDTGDGKQRIAASYLVGGDGAHSAVRRQAGIEFNSALLAVRFAVDRRDGKPVIKLLSNSPVNEPFLNVLVELSWNTGRLVREYTFLLDPPEYKGPQPIAQAPAANLEYPRPLFVLGLTARASRPVNKWQFWHTFSGRLGQIVDSRQNRVLRFRSR